MSCSSSAAEQAVAQTIGTLSLSLRSLADNASELEQAIASGAASVGDSKDPRAEKAMIDKLANTPQAGNSTYVVGTQRPITQDTTGTLCDAGGSGGSGTGCH